MHTAETGGTTISVQHPSGGEGVRAPWTPHTTCWLINMTFWHVCHLRKPPAYRHTHEQMLTTFITHPLDSAGHMLPDVPFNLCLALLLLLPGHSHSTKGLSDVWRTDVRCRVYNLSRGALTEEEHACTYGQSGLFTGCSVVTVLQWFHSLLFHNYSFRSLICLRRNSMSQCSSIRSKGLVTNQRHRKWNVLFKHFLMFVLKQKSAFEFKGWLTNSCIGTATKLGGSHKGHQ